MPQALIIAGIAAGIAGAGASIYSAQKQSEANKDIIRAQEQQNKVREQQMEADAQRRRLEVIRNQQRARANALSAATNQGAGQGSGLQGGYGQIAGQTSVNVEGINQNLGFGEQIFSLDNQISGYRQDSANAATIGAFGSGLSSLGGSLIGGASAYGRLTASGSPAGSSAGGYQSSPAVYDNNAFGNYGIY